MLAYVLDDALRRRLNAQGQNHWDVYLQEICTQLGVTASTRAPADLENPAELRDLRTLLIGTRTGQELTDRARANLRTWVEQGGLLIGFALTGLDDLFGIRTEGTLPQPTDDYTISAYVQFYPHQLAREIHPFMDIEQMLFALSPVQEVARIDCMEVARVFDLAHNNTERPAITWRAHGKGFAAYFAFDVPKTIWLLHQGKPLPKIPEKQFALRTPQMQVLGPNSSKVPYADELVHLLQNMIAVTRQPFVYAIPPEGDKIPDALLYYAGDEYTGPTEWSTTASDFMKSRGLPYHINIAAHLHPMTKAEFDHIRSNGHEVSAYMWLWTEDKKGSIITAERFKTQCDALQERFGVSAGSVLVGSCQWQGWSETARWLAEAGATADNTFIGYKASVGGARQDGKRRYGGPWYNGPFYGFGFGTAYPFFFYDDAAHGNQRLPIQEQPIVGYELGHRASNVIDERETIRETDIAAPEDLHEPLDRAVRYHQVICLFYHPYYIAHYAHCRAGIDEIKRYIAYQGAHILHMANNAVADWWNARAQTVVTTTFVDAQTLRFTSTCAWPAGMIVRLRWTDNPAPRVIISGKPVTPHLKREFGDDWLYVIVPSGAQQIEIVTQVESLAEVGKS